MIGDAVSRKKQSLHHQMLQKEKPPDEGPASALRSSASE